MANEDEKRSSNSVPTMLGYDRNSGEIKNISVDSWWCIVTADLDLEIARGNIAWMDSIKKFWQAPDFDTTDGFVTLWDWANDGGTNEMTYNFSTTAAIDSLSSSNNWDTQDIEVQWLDSNYDLVTQTVTITWQSRKALTTSLIRVFRMKNVWTTDLVGTLYCYENTAITAGVPNDTSKIRAEINNWNNQTLMALYTIPRGKTWYLTCWHAAQANVTWWLFSTDGASTVKLLARPFWQVFQLKHISTLKSNGSSHIQHFFKVPKVYSEKTDIKLEANTSVDGSAVAWWFIIILIDN